jgi:hypothetical protein
LYIVEVMRFLKPDLWSSKLRSLWKASENWYLDWMAYGAWAIVTVASHLLWFEPADIGQWIALGLLGTVLAISAVSLGPTPVT